MKNKTYILRDYTHVTQTLVVIDAPLTQELLGNLDELEKITDLHYMFLKSSPRDIDPERFSELCQGASYSVYPGTSEADMIMRVIEYDRELFPGQHLYWMITSVSRGLGGTPEGYQGFIESIPVFRRSVFRTSRYPFETLEARFKSPAKRWWWESVDRVNTYTTHTVLSDVVGIRAELIDRVSEFLEKKPGYTETFTGFWDFLGSVSHRIPGKNEVILEKEVIDVKVAQAIGE